MTEYDPNIRRPQYRVKLPMPVKSKALISINPKDAQNSDCDASNKLKEKYKRWMTKNSFLSSLNGIRCVKPYSGLWNFIEFETSVIPSTQSLRLFSAYTQSNMIRGWGSQILLN